VGNAALTLGFTLDRSTRPALTLAAALPSASHVTLLARPPRRRRRPHRAHRDDFHGAGIPQLQLLTWNFGAGPAGLK
jgi:hypothetical protein